MFASDPDRQLYEGIHRRDPDAAANLMHRYGNMLLLVIYRCLGYEEIEDAKDVLSEVLFSIWMDIEEYDPRRARFKTWLVMKARYESLGWWRKRSVELRPYAKLPPGEGDLSAEQALLRTDLVMALLKLGEVDRQIVYLCDFLERDHREVAAELGIKRGTLNTRLVRVRKRLREVLAGWRIRQGVPGGGHE